MSSTSNDDCQYKVKCCIFDCNNVLDINTDIFIWTLYDKEGNFVEEEVICYYCNLEFNKDYIKEGWINDDYSTSNDTEQEEEEEN